MTASIFNVLGTDASPTIGTGHLIRCLTPAAALRKCGVEVIQPGKKVHEVLVAEDEACTIVEFDGMFVIAPMFP